MKNLLIGIVIGIIIQSVGFSGIAKILDNSVTKIQTFAKESAK